MYREVEQHEGTSSTFCWPYALAEPRCFQASGRCLESSTQPHSPPWHSVLRSSFLKDDFSICLPVQLSGSQHNVQFVFVWKALRAPLTVTDELKARCSSLTTTWAQRKQQKADCGSHQPTGEENYGSDMCASSLLAPTEALSPFPLRSSAALRSSSAAWNPPALPRKDGIHTGATPIRARLTSLFISPSAKSKHCNLLLGALTESPQKDRAHADQDRPCRVFLTSLHQVWPASENSISCCFMKALFFFFCCFMNNITMPCYTLDHSFTRDAQGCPRKAAALPPLHHRRMAT